MKQLEHHEIKNKTRKSCVSLLVHNIHSPYNIGSLFRLADNLGIAKLYFSGESVHLPNKKVLKTARATQKYLAHSFIDNPIQKITSLKKKNYTIISLEYCDNSSDISNIEIPTNSNILFIIGEENRGVNAEFLVLSDYVCHIEMYGKSTSMNVITATAIACYEIFKKIEK